MPVYAIFDIPSLKLLINYISAVFSIEFELKKPILGIKKEMRESKLFLIILHDLENFVFRNKSNKKSFILFYVVVLETQAIFLPVTV